MMATPSIIAGGAMLTRPYGLRCLTSRGSLMPGFNAALRLDGRRLDDEILVLYCTWGNPRTSCKAEGAPAGLPECRAPERKDEEQVVTHPSRPISSKWRFWERNAWVRGVVGYAL